MKRVSLMFIALALFPLITAAKEIGYVEDFSLATDRAEALEQLIPGTENYYCYHALYYQHLEQFDRVDELLKAWITRYKYRGRVREILNRQALLKYDQNPSETLEYIRKQLGIRFDHRQERRGRKPSVPIALDQELIDRERFTQRAFRRHKNLQGFADSALDWLVEVELNPDRRRHLLQRLQSPDYPSLPRLVVDDLNYRHSKGFGSFAIHRQLLQPQLEECLRLKSDLLNQTHFVNTYLTKLHPNPDVNWQHNAQEHQAYLDRLWELVSRLGSVHNSLKAHVAYHRLVSDRARGVYDEHRFMSYIRLPRNVPYINADYMRLKRNRHHQANLSQDFTNLTLLPPVGNDEPVVRSYLQHFLLNTHTTKTYETYINDIYLHHTFSEVKITAGLGDSERWYSLLPADKYQELRDRIDLDFAYTNKRIFKATEPVSLDMIVKNVRTLLVKVYKINTKNYYQQHLREVSTDINLDGLIPNIEYTHEFTDPPLRRVARHFDFPQLSGPGAFVIDFIGNGRSSRVVVRKGRLSYLVRSSTAGHVFTVLDEQNQTVPDASLWMEGHEYRADQQGMITIPYSNRPGRQPIILSRGDFCSLVYFQHESENYQLRAGIFVDRESLLNRNNATVVIRPGLYLNGTPVTLSVLEDPELSITSTDHDGVSTTKEVKDFKLYEDRESIYEFQVPSRLAQITFSLKAQVKNLARSKKIDLAVGESFSVNEIDKTDKVDTLHFVKVNGNYVIELLGKTGEPKGDRPVQFSIKHHDFRDPIPVTLKTNEQGRVRLGRLKDIASVTATEPQGNSQSWQLRHDQHTYPVSRHARVGETIELPYMSRRSGSLPAQPGVPARHEFSLLEMRGNTYVADRFDALSIQHGLLQIKGLMRGDYELHMKREDTRVRLRVTEGEEREGYVLGANRRLEVRGQGPLQIEAVDATGDEIRVQLRHATKFTRVHVFATFYQQAFPAFHYLSGVRNAEPFVTSAPKLETLYAQGRNIGDEYRYILERRYATRFPGNMLERPSLLLNPWATRSTGTEQQALAEGEEFEPAEEPSRTNFLRLAGQRDEKAPEGEFANLDFLSHASAVLVNLVPDENGALVIPRAETAAYRQLHIVAVDPRNTACRQVSLSETERQSQDLRLIDALEPDKHYTQQKKVTVVRAEQTFELENIVTSRFESYDTLPKVYTLFLTLSADPKLVAFGFVLNWPEMSFDAKREKYSKYACHELNFFLYKKDREFFNDVVRPYLANKKEKTFLDGWLANENLDAFLSPWNYGRLNTVERILLAQRINGEQQHTARHILDTFNTMPPNIDRFNHLFNTAVKRSALDTETGEFGPAKERQVLERTLQKLKSLGYVQDRAREDSDETMLAFDGDVRKDPSESVVPGQSGANDRKKKELDFIGRKLRKRHPSSSSSRSAGQHADSVDKLSEGRQEKAFFFKDSGTGRKTELGQLYRKLEKTQEWVENNYYHLPIEQQNADLITANAFWSEYAKHNTNQPFYSAYLADASRNFPEMMYALSVLDIPFKADEHDMNFDFSQMRLIAHTPMVVFHEEIRESTIAADKTPILVSQHFFRHGDRYRHENNQRLDKFVVGEFLTGAVYGCQVVVTNPSSSPQQLDLLLQVPAGAIPVMNGQYTKSAHIDLPSFNTQTIEYFFYFPETGRFAHYPVHIASNERLLAHAAPFSFHVVDVLSKVDTESWDYISQQGTQEQVIEYLQGANLHRTKLDRIAWRMHDKSFFQRVTAFLTQRHTYNHTLWSYSIKHDIVPAVRQYLQHADQFVAQCGDMLYSPLLVIDPVMRDTYQHRDYKPLVNARAHQVGKRRQILNPHFYEQYHRLLKILSYRRELTDDDLMAVIYYMLLQNRIEEARDLFSRVNPGRLATQLQYDYLTAYLSFYTADQQIARDIADRYADFPVDHWKKAFAGIGKQLDELAGDEVSVVDTEDRTQQQTKLAGSESNFEFKVESKKIRIDYHNVKAVRVNYYLMDIELMFSTNPFVQEHGETFLYIHPNRTQVVELPVNESSLEFTLPAELHNRNVLVEISAADQTKTQTYYSNSLTVQTSERYGQLRVAHHNTQQTLAKVYVKVYARMKDGKIRFHKDGYTDIRGRFDYTSLNTNELDFVQQFSFLILSDDHGAVIRAAYPPKR